MWVHTEDIGVVKSHIMAYKLLQRQVSTFWSLQPPVVNILPLYNEAKENENMMNIRIWNSWGNDRPLDDRYFNQVAAIAKSTHSVDFVKTAKYFSHEFVQTSRSAVYRGNKLKKSELVQGIFMITTSYHSAIILIYFVSKIEQKNN